MTMQEFSKVSSPDWCLGNETHQGVESIRRYKAMPRWLKLKLKENEKGKWESCSQTCGSQRWLHIRITRESF